MTIVLFLVDTSASMAQKSYLGTSLLDFAKAAVETFLKVNRCRRRLGVVQLFWSTATRSAPTSNDARLSSFQQRARDPSARGDRYMLMTLEEFPKNVKVMMNGILLTEQNAMHSCCAVVERDSAADTNERRCVRIACEGVYLGCIIGRIAGGLARGTGDLPRAAQGTQAKGPDDARARARRGLALPQSQPHAERH